MRHPLAGERDDPGGEGDVGGHRHAPPRPRFGRAREEQVQPRGHQHAAQRAECGQQRLATVRQPPVMQLAPNLEPHHEEEDDHQPVVDEPLERALEHQPAELQRHRRGPEGMHLGAQRRVGEPQRHQRGQPEHDAARGFHAQKAIERLRRGLRPLTQTRRDFGRERLTGLEHDGTCAVRQEVAARPPRGACDGHRRTRTLSAV